MEAPELQQARRIVIKVGTSLLTHPGGSLHLGRMEALVRQVSDLRGSGREAVLVSSGAVGAGMGRLGLTSRSADVTEKQALAAVGQGVLMHTYEKLFGEYGHTVAQILLTRADVEAERRRASARRVVDLLLGWRVIPVVNENDTVADEEIRVGDNDTLAALVAVLTAADLLIILSDIDALYDGDPGQPEARRVPVVTELSPAVWAMARGPGSQNATGGMLTKLTAAGICLEAGIPMVIASGHQSGVVTRIAAGDVPGTLFCGPRPATGTQPATGTGPTAGAGNAR